MNCKAGIQSQVLLAWKLWDFSLYSTWPDWREKIFVSKFLGRPGLPTFGSKLHNNLMTWQCREREQDVITQESLLPHQNRTFSKYEKVQSHTQKKKKKWEYSCFKSRGNPQQKQRLKYYNSDGTKIIIYVMALQGPCRYGSQICHTHSEGQETALYVSLGSKTILLTHLQELK